MNTLSITNLSLSYKNGVKALQQVNLHITNGMFGLLGPNGAGKSSLMKTIVGLQRPQSGQISFNGKDVIQEPRYLQQYLGFLPQDFGVYPKISAWQLLDHLARLKGIVHASERKQQIGYLLDRVNLTAQRYKEVATFSGGMRQRFGVAQALLGNPRIIIVDEPTAGLDPEERNRFNMLLNGISEDIIVILSTHLVEDVRHLCAEMAIMNNGMVLAYGKPGQLIQELAGRIWSREIALADIEQYAQQYRIISRQLIARRMHITVYEQGTPAGFQPLTPALEHVYFNVLQTKS